LDFARLARSRVIVLPLPSEVRAFAVRQVCNGRESRS